MLVPTRERSCSVKRSREMRREAKVESRTVARFTYALVGMRRHAEACGGKTRVPRREGKETRKRGARGAGKEEGGYATYREVQSAPLCASLRLFAPLCASCRSYSDNAWRKSRVYFRFLRSSPVLQPVAPVLFAIYISRYAPMTNASCESSFRRVCEAASSSCEERSGLEQPACLRFEQLELFRKTPSQSAYARFYGFRRRVLRQYTESPRDVSRFSR